MEQLNMFEGMERRDDGMKKALENADQQHYDWSQRAFIYLLWYCTRNTVFMAENVRMASVGVIARPPHARAWGAVMVRAARAGIIRKRGYRNVSNPLAHRTPATLWEVVIDQ